MSVKDTGIDWSSITTASSSSGTTVNGIPYQGTGIWGSITNTPYTYTDPVPREKTKQELITEFIIFTEVESRVKMVLEKVAQKKLTADEALDLLKGDKNVVVANG